MTNILAKNSNTLKFSDKISAIRKHFGYSQDVLAEKIGVSGSAIGLLQQGKTKSPSADMLAGLTRVLGINPDWLLNDEGPMIRFGPGHQNISSYPPGLNNVHAVAPLSAIPVVELGRVSFSARASFNYAQLQRFMNSDLFDKVLHRLPPGRTAEDYKEALVFDIEGDSMEPSLRDGQQVIAWPVPESKWEHLHNTICVVDFDDSVTVKAIFKNDLFTTDGLVLHATGGPGGEFTVARNLIHSIWEVREFYGPVPVRLIAA